MKLGLRRAFWTRDGGIDRSLIACALLWKIASDMGRNCDFMSLLSPGHFLHWRGWGKVNNASSEGVLRLLFVFAGIWGSCSS